MPQPDYHRTAGILENWQWVLAEAHAVLNQELAAKFIRDNVVSKDRLTEMVLDPTWAEDPIIFAKDGAFTGGRPDVMLVDGHHRYVLHATFSRSPFFPGWVLEEAQWRPFQIKGLPQVTEAQLKAQTPKPWSRKP